MKFLMNTVSIGSKIIVISGFIFFSLIINSYSRTTIDYLSELSIEDLMDINVDSAGFFDVPKNEAPGSIWILDEKKINDLPANNLKDLLNLYVPGVMLSSHSIFVSLYSSRGSTSFDNSSTQFMYDGINLNSAGSLGVNSSLKSSLLGDISKIEVSTAPSGIVYGNGAMNGFVNIVPKKGSINPGVFVKTQYGTKENSFSMETGYGYTYGLSGDLYIYAGMEGSQGKRPDGDLGYSSYYNNDKINDKFIVNKKDWSDYKASINWNHNNFSLNFLAQKEKVTSETCLSEKSVYSPSIYYNSVALRPGLEIPLTSKETIKAEVPVAFFDTGYISYRDKGLYLYKKEHGASNMRISPELIFKTTRFNRHKFALGFKFSYEHYRVNKYYFHSDPDYSPIGSNADWREYTFFAEDIYQIKPWWTITAGIRLDRIIYDLPESVIDKYAKDSGVWSPRFTSSFMPAKNTILKLAYQEGFHFPPANQLYTDDFKPEEIKNYEIGLIQSFPEQGLKININSFFNIYKNSLLLVKASGNSSDNNKFASCGGEMMVNWKMTENFESSISYSYSRPIDISDDVDHLDSSDPELKKWINYPAHIIKALETAYFFDRRLMTSLSFEYSSGVKQTEYSWDEPRKLYAGDRYTVSFKSEYAVSDHFFVNMIVKNLAHNNIPVPNFPYLQPWEGSLGEDETYFYLGFSWR